AAAGDQVRDEAWRERDERERQRIGLFGLGGLLRSRCPAEAVGRKGGAEIRIVGDRRVGQLVVVGGGYVDDPRLACGRREPCLRRRGLLGAAHVELPFGEHEIALG